MYFDKPESELQMAKRHVREAERRLAKQRKLLDRLREGGHPTDVAEVVTNNLENALENYRHSVARLMRARSGT